MYTANSLNTSDNAFKDDQIVLTPTYHVFRMYSVHQDAVLLPVELRGQYYTNGADSIPALSVSASRDKEGKIHVSMANLHPTKAQTLRCELKGATCSGFSGEIITATAMNAYNDFGKPPAVIIRPYTDAQIAGGTVTIALPAKSVVTLEVD